MLHLLQRLGCSWLLVKAEILHMAPQQVFFHAQYLMLLEQRGKISDFFPPFLAFQVSFFFILAFFLLSFKAVTFCCNCLICHTGAQKSLGFGHSKSWAYNSLSEHFLMLCLICYWVLWVDFSFPKE